MWPYSTPGIPDDRFVRGDVPMTKEEVRTLTLSKARIRPEYIIIDVGAGTGSLTVECALQVPAGKVYAIEREPAALKLIKQNCSIFEVDNVQVIAGSAPEAMQGLPESDVVLIGGSGGCLAEIITAARKNLAKSGRVVINAVTLETISTAKDALLENGFCAIEIVSVSVTRWNQVGSSHMAKALNPVFIISAELRS